MSQIFHQMILMKLYLIILIRRITIWLVHLWAISMLIDLQNRLNYATKIWLMDSSINMSSSNPTTILIATSISTKPNPTTSSSCPSPKNYLSSTQLNKSPARSKLRGTPTPNNCKAAKSQTPTLKTTTSPSPISIKSIRKFGRMKSTLRIRCVQSSHLP